jgi:activator of HSP90 ATPase
MAHEFTVNATIPATPREVYDAWLNSKCHTEMTGSAARGSAKLGGKFTAWDGYITARNVKLVVGRRIVQAWRTNEFSKADPDSQIDVKLEKAPGGTKLTLRHSGVPDGHSGYRSGWRTHYFEPMKAYFKAAKKKV